MAEVTCWNPLGGPRVQDISGLNLSHALTLQARGRPSRGWAPRTWPGPASPSGVTGQQNRAGGPGWQCSRLLQPLWSLRLHGPTPSPSPPDPQVPPVCVPRDYLPDTLQASGSEAPRAFYGQGRPRGTEGQVCRGTPVSGPRSRSPGGSPPVDWI